MGLVLVETGEFSRSRGAACTGRLTVILVQVQNCFDELKRAWEGRKSELEARLKALGGAGLFGGGGGGYDDYGDGGSVWPLPRLERR